MTEKKYFNDTTPFAFQACQYVNDLVDMGIDPEQRCAMWYIAFNAGNGGVAEIRLSDLELHFGGCPQETARQSLRNLDRLGIIEFATTREPGVYLCCFRAAGTRLGTGS